VPAFATAVHKSQGSEYPAVVMPIVGEHDHMLRRNLVCTSITRSRELCALAGDVRLLGIAARKPPEQARCTALGEMPADLDPPDPPDDRLRIKPESAARMAAFR